MHSFTWIWLAIFLGIQRELGWQGCTSIQFSLCRNTALAEVPGTDVGKRVQSYPLGHLAGGGGPLTSAWGNNFPHPAGFINGTA